MNGSSKTRKALACDRKATLSDVREEDDVFWMSCSKTLRLLYKSSIDSVSIFFFVLIVMARLSHAGGRDLKNFINLNTAFEEVNTGNAAAIPPSADHEEEVFSDADDDDMPEIRIYDKSSESIFDKASYYDAGIITDFNNLPDEVDVPTNPTLRIHNAHPQSQILGDPNTPVQTRSSLKKITEAHALFEPRKVTKALEDCNTPKNQDNAAE
ncbi:hypothetical protein Tco_0561969, partial [Tanacetum coccineum]